MTQRPINATMHGLIDYGFLALNLLAPSLLGLKGSARAAAYSFAATQGLLNALTNTPVGLVKAVPLRVHGELETPFVPGIVLVPWLTGALKQRNARLYFGAFFAMAAAAYLLTDFNDGQPLTKQPSGQRIFDALGDGLN